MWLTRLRSDVKGNPVWATKTDSSGSTVICAVQNDGNVVLYKGTPIWSSNTQK
jgi:hypothetical protein